jgi:phage shock protein A
MNNPEIQTIEKLRERFQALHTEKVRAEQDYKNAQETLEKLQEQAREQFETDDLEQLQAMLAKIEEENLEKRKEYQASLDQIDANLKKVEDSEEQSSPDVESTDD